MLGNHNEKIANGKFNFIINDVDAYYFAFCISTIPMSFIDDKTGRFLDVNQAYLDYLGYQRKEVIGRTSLELNLFVNKKDDAIYNSRYSELCLENLVKIKTKKRKIKYCMLHTKIINWVGNKIRYTILQGQVNSEKEEVIKCNAEHRNAEHISDFALITEMDELTSFEITNNKKVFGVVSDNIEKKVPKYDESIFTISKISDLMDGYTGIHQRRVKELSCAIATEMRLNKDIINNISIGALIHDVGKLYIDYNILNKPSKLTELEYNIMQTHVAYGYYLAKEINLPWQVATMIYQHHECLDGSGYPEGISGDQIIIESRILTVADIVEAMNSNRPYRSHINIDEVLEEISKYKGVKYDEEVVEACIKLFKGRKFLFTNFNN